jgi:protein BCP1
MAKQRRGPKPPAEEAERSEEQPGGSNGGESDAGGGDEPSSGSGDSSGGSGGSSDEAASSSDDGSSAPEVSDDEEEEEDDEDRFDEVNVQFEFFDPKEIDFHGLKALLHTYLDGGQYDGSALADTIIAQAGSRLVYWMGAGQTELHAAAEELAPLRSQSSRATAAA